MHYEKVYLDNASTTAFRPEVIQEMTRVMQEDYGNPSSTHSFGRTSKNILETSRKSIAKQINATAQEIIFTSGGTEANNWILRSAVEDLKIKRIITSKIEHHAVLHTVLALESDYQIQVDYVKLKQNGEVDINHLVELLSDDIPTLVSLMHVNNEIGTVLDLEKVGRLCKQYKALFHSDTVQSIGKPKLICRKRKLILSWQALINSTDRKELVLLLSEEIQDCNRLFWWRTRKRTSCRN